jgi:hypothetical protein
MGVIRVTCPLLLVLLLLVASSLDHGKEQCSLIHENRGKRARHVLLTATYELQDCCKLLATESAEQVMCW